MFLAHSLMVGSSGTSRPLLEYSTKTRPNGSSIRRFRKASPQAKWNRFGIEPRIFPCVPLPEPGAPKRRMVRYFITLSGGAGPVQTFRSGRSARRARLLSHWVLRVGDSFKPPYAGLALH